MTKEELEKEAQEIYQKTDKEFMDCQDEGEIFNLGYLAGAEPREKRIAELEAQIEKMKLCANCRHCGVSGWCNKLNRYLLDKANQCCGNWEIKEK